MTSAAECAKECSADPECNGWSHFHPKDRFDRISAPPFLPFALLFHCLTFSFQADILNKIIPSEVRFYILFRCYIKSSLKGTIVEFPGTESGLRPCLWLNKSDQLTHNVGCKTSVASNMPVTDKFTKSRKKCMRLDITTVFFHILVKDCDLLCNMLGKSFFIDKVLPKFSNLNGCKNHGEKIQEKVFQIYTNAKTFIQELRS